MLQGSRVDTFNRALGERLRAARRACGLSLVDVEGLSEGEFKASVLGAYERGERSLSVLRLTGLARMYGVDPGSLIPLEEVSTGEEPVVVDLKAIEDMGAAESALLDDFLEAIQRMRQRAGEPGLAVRRSDLNLLSVLLGAASRVPSDIEEA